MVGQMDRYQAALDFIYSFVDYETSRKPRSPLNYDLRRMDELLARVGNPHLAAKTVHIAGTKGKGSTAAMVASVLAESGYKTGLYTSPHLIDISERMRVNGIPVSRNELLDLVARIRPEVEAVNAAARYGCLTTFEVLTALGFMFFADSKADFQVVEVGLGGRLDATNVVKPEVCAITTLGLDHTDVLGDTLAKIASEKAGIIKPGVPVVSAQQEQEAAEVIAEFCSRNGAPLTKVGRDIKYCSLASREGLQSMEIRGRLGSYRIELPLLGGFQRENAAVAVGILEVLMEKGYNITPRSIADGLKQVRWPGRFQVIRTRPDVVIDGAHNPQSAHQLSIALRDYLKDRQQGCKVLVIGMSSDKDIGKVAAELAPLFSLVIATRSRHPRALDAERLAACLSGYDCEVRKAASVAEAMNTAAALAQEDGFVCATGSLFIVGEALEWAGLPGC
jgi:dihydrofolate synthase/folylpolyglutamate synthase